MLGTPLEKVFVGRRCWWVTNPKVSYLATYPRFYNGEYAQAMSDLRLFMSGKWNWIEIGPALLAFSIEMHWVDLSGAQYGLQGKTTFYPRWDLSVAGNQSVAVKWRLWNIILQKVSLCLEPKPKQESRFRPQLELIFAISRRVSRCWIFLTNEWPEVVCVTHMVSTQVFTNIVQ